MSKSKIARKTATAKKQRENGSGNVERKGRHLYARVSLPGLGRQRYRLCPDEGPCHCATLPDDVAQERAAEISEQERAKVAAVRKSVANVKATTVRDFGEQWTDGKLHKRWPDHVKLKRTADDDRMRFDLHVYPLLGKIPIALVTLDDCERVMARLPSELATASRRHVAQLLHRLLGMAVYPARLREANPLPRGFLPKVTRTKALTWLYPDEEAKLLACERFTDAGGVEREAPLAERLLFGFLAREGMREGEALALTWADVDLKRGVLTLDVNKTDEPRAWALRADVVQALTRWKALRSGKPSDPIFPVQANALAIRLRAYVRGAGVTRAELFKSSAVRQQLRVHDLRATFVTLALAHGRSEAWVSDRTGHRSSAMIFKYKRAARTAAELGVSELCDLAAAIPEIKALANVRTIAG